MNRRQMLVTSAAGLGVVCLPKMAEAERTEPQLVAIGELKPGEMLWGVGGSGWSNISIFRLELKSPCPERNWKSLGWKNTKTGPGVYVRRTSWSLENGFLYKTKMASLPRTWKGYRTLEEAKLGYQQAVIKRLGECNTVVEKKNES